MALLDFVDFKYTQGAVPKEDRVRKKFRVKRGFCFWALALVALYVYYIERILEIRIGLWESFLYFGVPYSLPLLGLLYLRKKYKLPWKLK